MLMILLTAILSEDSIAYAAEDARNATGHAPSQNGHGFLYKTQSKRFDMSIRSGTSTTMVPSTVPNIGPTSWTNIVARVRVPLERDDAATIATDHIDHLPNKPETEDQENAYSGQHLTNIERDLTPESSMHKLQFYAQPLPPSPVTGLDLSTQSTHGPYSYDLFTPPTTHVYVAPLSAYKTIPQELVNNGELLSESSFYKPPQYYFNSPVAATQRATIFDVPSAPLANVYKRNDRWSTPVTTQPQRVFVVAPLRAPSSVTALPPVSVTKIYKYTEDKGGLKPPSLHDNLPTLSAAFNGHQVRDRVTSSIAIRNYLSPARVLKQRIYYHNPFAGLAHAAYHRNEFRLINKFNDELRNGYAQRGGKAANKKEVEENGRKKGEHEDENVEVDVEEEKEKKYTDEDVEKALTYNHHLKRTNRERNRYLGNVDEREEGMKKKMPEDNDDGEQLEADTTLATKKRKKQKNDINFDDDKDFQSTSFSDVDETQEESRTKLFKANNEDCLTLQQTQIIPNVNDENTVEDELEQLDMDIGVGDGGNERVEFQLHGLVGPESYKFGYDTGKGVNRQFRYEERDGEGKVKGHFGYNNKDGELQVFNYEADPEHGYHLEKANEH